MSAEHPLTEYVDNLVYEPTQVHDDGVDLTVSAIYDVAEPGRLDFGGDELEDAGLDPLPTAKRREDDEYEWWDLEAGQYVVQHNEFLTDPDEPLFLQPRNELLARGCSHPSVRVIGHLPLLPLSVAGGGIRIKENARVSTLLATSGSEAQE